MESVFPDWQKFAVSQKRPLTGCIPTAYEIILRAADAPNVNFDSFQDDFDLDYKLPPGSEPIANFQSVADAIEARYPHIHLKREAFPKDRGEDKLAFVEDFLRRQSPVLVSITTVPFGENGWHAMPVVDATDSTLVLLIGLKADGSPDLLNLLKSDFVKFHRDFPGGDDVAYLEKIDPI